LVEDPRRIERHQLKLGLNPHILAHSVLGGRGVRAGFSKDFESVSSAHPLSLPLAPSCSLSLPLPLPPCTCNSQSRSCVKGGDPLFEGSGRQGQNGGQAVDGREGVGFLFPRVLRDSPWESCVNPPHSVSHHTCSRYIPTSCPRQDSQKIWRGLYVATVWHIYRRKELVA